MTIITGYFLFVSDVYTRTNAAGALHRETWLRLFVFVICTNYSPDKSKNFLSNFPIDYTVVKVIIVYVCGRSSASCSTDARAHIALR